MQFDLRARPQREGSGLAEIDDYGPNALIAHHSHGERAPIGRGLEWQPSRTKRAKHTVLASQPQGLSIELGSKLADPERTRIEVQLRARKCCRVLRVGYVLTDGFVFECPK